MKVRCEMSILIKGADIPSCCKECDSDFHVGVTMMGGRCPFCTTILEPFEWDKVRHPDCPLVELPPHGLIDKQMLLRNIADNQMANAGVGHDLEYGFWQRMWEYINDAPTIIEAEVEE